MVLIEERDEKKELTVGGVGGGGCLYLQMYPAGVCTYLKKQIFVLFAVVSCGDPGAPANGVRYGDTFTYQSVVILECDPKYKLVGDLTRTCQANGQWSKSQPTCQCK